VRSRKTLACTRQATAFQKAFGQDLKRQVIDEGQPFVIAQADTPHEIFHAMDIPVISNQWWSAYISAKQLSGRYFDAMAEAAIRPTAASTARSGLACTLANDPQTAPWGGLPTPTVLVARLTCDCIQHVFTQWAAAMGTGLLRDGRRRLGDRRSRRGTPAPIANGKASTSPTASP
jgi:hypothetical protein